MGTNSAIVHSEGKKYNVPSYLEQLRQDENFLYKHNELNELTEEGPLFIVFPESPYASISTVRSGHPSLISLMQTAAEQRMSSPVVLETALTSGEGKVQFR
jgi:hypothetical protein